MSDRWRDEAERQWERDERDSYRPKDEWQTRQDRQPPDAPRRVGSGRPLDPYRGNDPSRETDWRFATPRHGDLLPDQTGQGYGSSTYESPGYGGAGRDQPGEHGYRGRSPNWGGPGYGQGGMGVRRGEWDEADRGFIDRAADEVASWFGDDDAERRRREDEHDERHRWRRRDW